MGLIISRFRRKKTTIQLLEKIETKIQSIEEQGKWTEQQHKRVIGYMMAYSVGIYVLFAILYYFMYQGRSKSWIQSLVYASPLLVLPIMVFMLRRGVSWYYNRKLRRDQLQLSKFRDEKKKLLEEVMETETYKIAKEILEKFGSSEQNRAMKPFVPTTNVPGNTLNTTPSPATPGQLRLRKMPQTSTPTNPANNHLSIMPNTPNNLSLRGPLKSDQLIRPLVGGQRTAMDKVVDYLLGDGPNSRLALICSECHSHNGMAMLEEYEYVGYFCAYCRKYNPARKQRPTAPPLTMSPRALAITAVADDSSAVSSASDSEDDKAEKHSGSDGDSGRSPSPRENKSDNEDQKK